MSDVLTIEPMETWDAAEWLIPAKPGREGRIERIGWDERENELSTVSLEDLELVKPNEFLSPICPPLHTLIMRMEQAWPKSVRLGFAFARAFMQLSEWPSYLERMSISKIACIGARVKVTPGTHYYLRLECVNGARIAGPRTIAQRWIRTTNPYFTVGERVAFFIPPQSKPEDEWF